MRKRPRFHSIPTATGGIAKAAYAEALQAGVDVGPVLKACNLTAHQLKDPQWRMPVETQIRFLNRVADALSDAYLGAHLAERIDLRQLGLLYYVLASSETLGDALARVARYSGISNEAIHITCREQKDIIIKFQYEGVTRLGDVHQIEFFVVTLLRTCRQLTGRYLLPERIKLAHRRTELPAKMKKLFGCDVLFGSNADEVEYAAPVKTIPCLNADPYLNSMLVRYCDEALPDRRVRAGSWRSRVENAIVPLLPHGQANMLETAGRLGVSGRTLARLLASEGCTFSGILDALRSDLARTYLREDKLPISQIAWLLGFRAPSAFTHACKRWTGKTPREERSFAVRTCTEACQVKASLRSIDR
jgi:AraC-like DNA-binding protein